MPLPSFSLPPDFLVVACLLFSRKIKTKFSQKAFHVSEFYGLINLFLLYLKLCMPIIKDVNKNYD